MGIDKWIEKMLYFADQLRRLKVDGYEYVSMKVIVLLTSGKPPKNQQCETALFDIRLLFQTPPG